MSRNAPSPTGVLLVNLGTPEAPTAHAVRNYLSEFLSDPRVVDYPRWLWLPILYGVILNVRPARSARAYAKIWTDEGSPLFFHTRNAARALGARIGNVEFAMRYGQPSVRERINALANAGARRIVVAPMYPQYSRSTVASVEDAVTAAGATCPVEILPPFFDRPLYIAALKARAETHLAGLDWAPERIVLSFHGAPKRWSADGDPYEDHCRETARRLRAAMGWSEDFAPLAFQSRFGREEWLGPPTDGMIKDLAAAGVRRLAVMTPGFMADCLETLEEIAIGGGELFHQAGGEAFTAIPCLNDSPETIDLLEDLVASAAARGQ